MDALGAQAINDAAAGNPWALIAVVVGVVFYMLEKIAHWWHKLRVEAKVEERGHEDNRQLAMTMVEIHRNTQSMAIILDKHLDLLEVLDKNTEKTKDGVQRVENLLLAGSGSA